ncbi:alpha/beta hydrolase [Vulcanococcus limneticus]|uniref:alpha/beta hydrolase n=1 Tax=Vulcanococcus limneticus TaxID=2170428 RepID=UPI00398BC70F
MLKRLAAGLFAGAALTAVALPASAAVDNDLPIRWNTGGAVWSTDQAAINTFLKTGEITDRGLASGISRSGWTAKEIRTGFNKTYSVDLVGVSRFLYSDAGVKFLKNQTRSYFPYWTLSTYAVQGLRSAIIADARDGQISSAGILAALPTDFRLADTCNTYDGKQNVCAEGKCVGEAQCTSLLSWYVFLPACIQANQVADAAAAIRTTSAPAPVQEPVRGLW